EMQHINNPSLYLNDPKQSWLRLKMRDHHPHRVSALQKLAEWREIEAQKRNRPRNHIIKDDLLINIARLLPKNKDELTHVRLVPKSLSDWPWLNPILRCVRYALENPVTLPPEKRPQNANHNQLILLKMLLQIKSHQARVVARLIASEHDLKDLICKNNKQNPVLQGWRYQIFGQDACALLDGKISIRLKNEAIHLEYL
ncbi:MAG: HRDC domain-containing protein, partial [Pseudomonadota bacterium]